MHNEKSQGRFWTVRVVVAALVVTLAYAAGLGVAAGRQDASVNGQPDTPAVREAAAPPPPDVDPTRPLTPSEREASLRALSPRDRAGAAAILDYADAGRTPVCDHGGTFRGYIGNDGLYADEVQSADDLHEVHGENGEVTGYWGGDLGFIEIEVARSEDFDPDKIRAEQGIRSFWIDESGQEHPL